ncbi:MAG: hypothetical protein ACX939_11585, partial [Hyphococcus sp.]
VRQYLAEAYRVSKPGGCVIGSYLDRHVESHVTRFRAPWRQRLSRMLGRDVMISHTTQAEIQRWFEDAGFIVEETITQSPIGQHVMIGRKPDAGHAGASEGPRP